MAAKIKRKSNKEANLINEIVPPTQHEKCKTVAENEDTRVWDVAGDVDNKEFVYSAAYLDKLAEDVIKCRVPEPVLCLKQLVVIPKKKVKKVLRSYQLVKSILQATSFHRTLSQDFKF